MEIKEHTIKLTGKASLFEPMTIDTNYSVTLEGTVVSSTDQSNEDGSVNRTYTFKPILVSVLNEKGEAMKVSDTRSRSQQLRGVIWKQWQASGQDVSEDEFYDKKMREIIAEQMEI